MNDENSESTTLSDERAAKRKSRDEQLAAMRASRKTFWLPSPETLDETAQRICKEGVEAAAQNLRNSDWYVAMLRNALAHLGGRLICLVHERDLLEEAYREEKAECDRRTEMHLSAEKRLTDAMGMYHDLKKQAGKPAKRKAASR